MFISFNTVPDKTMKHAATVHRRSVSSIKSTGLNTTQHIHINTINVKKTAV